MVMSSWIMMVVFVHGVVVVVMIIVVVIMRRVRITVVTFAHEVPARRLTERLVEDPPALEGTQVGHRLGDRGAPHETFDAIPRPRPMHALGDSPRRRHAIPDGDNDLFEAMLVMYPQFFEAPLQSAEAMLVRGQHFVGFVVLQLVE